MDYRKLDKISCDDDCMFREGEKCELNIDKFKELEKQHMTRCIKCIGHQNSVGCEAVKKQLLVESQENEQAAVSEETLSGEIIPPYKSYAEYKRALDGEVKKEIEGYVRIGYLLKIARDTNILADSGYANIYELADSEYHIDKSRVSRYMAINDRFAAGGYGMELKDEYKGYGVAKLSMMLTLPEAIAETLSPDMSKRDIQIVRDEVAEEQKVTPLEHMIEGETQTTAREDTLLGKVILQIGETDQRMYAEVLQVFRGEQHAEKIKAIMAPSGMKIYSIRIQGIGRILLSLKDEENEVSLISERTGVKEEHNWTELRMAWLCCFADVMLSAEENYAAVYGKPMTVTASAPEQPSRTDRKVVRVNPERRKTAKTLGEESRMEEPKQETLHDIDRALPAPDPMPKEEEPEPGQEAEPEQQIQGQTSIENFVEKTEGKTEQQADKITQKDFRKSAEELRKRYTGYTDASGLAVDDGDWAIARNNLHKAIGIIDSLEELYEMEIEDEEE